MKNSTQFAFYFLCCCGILTAFGVNGQGNSVSFGSDKNNQAVGDSLATKLSQKYSSSFGQKKFLSVEQLQKQRMSGYQSLFNKSTGELRNPASIEHSNNGLLSKYANMYNTAELVRKAAMSKSLANGAPPLNSSEIRNNKYVKKYYDSIQKKMPKDPTAAYKNVSQEEMVKQVNQTFLKETKSATDSVSQMGAKTFQEGRSDVNKIDLARTKIDQEKINGLTPIRGYVLKSKYLKRVDSIRNVTLKGQRLKYNEETSAANLKISQMRQKETLWHKTYFEGIFNFQQSNSVLFQVSPALAYHITPHVSLGAGPNIIVRKQLTKISTTAGARVFGKFEFYKRYLYAQVEDQINPSTVSMDGSFFTQQNIYAGGGFVIPFLSPLTVNLSLLYKCHTNGQALNSSSPWIFRIGISTNKKKDNK